MRNSTTLKQAALSIALVTLGFTTNIHAADFAPAKTLTVGSGPSALASGDFNGDGIRDLAVTNYNDGTVSVLLGSTGNLGDFGSANDFAVGTDIANPTARQPFGIAVGEVVGNDTYPDIVAAISLGNEVTILPGNGDGTFGAPINVAAGTDPRDVILGNVDGSGGLDIITANYSTGMVTVLLNNNDGSFTPMTGSPFAAGTKPFSLVYADATGDGTPDIDFVNVTANTVSILVGPDFTTRTPVGIGTGTGPYGLAVADLNGDNKPDLATANTTGNSVSVLIGDGAGGFAAPVNTSLAGPSATREIAVADVGGTSAPDLVVSNTDQDTIDVLEGDGTGAFPSVTNTFPATHPRPLVLEDFGGDARLDIATSSSALNAALVLINDNQPVAADDTYTIISGTTNNALDVLANDSDPDSGDTLTITAADNPGTLGGTVSISGGTSLDYTPPASATGDDTFTYTIEDQLGYPSTATVTATVVANQPPVPTAPPITTDEDTDGTSQIAPNDPNTGDSFTYAVKTQGANGSASVSTTGLVTYKPNLNFNGTDSVTVTVTDSGGLSADVTIDVTVNAVNDPPVAVGSIAAQSATVGIAFGPLDVSGNFSDPDSTLTYSLSGLPAGTGLTIDSSTGVITGTPTDADANAPQPIKVTVSATDGSTPATQPFDLTVNSTSSTSTTSNHNGSGCTLSTGDAGKDPLMPALVLTAIVFLYRRRRRSEKC